ncbi:MAG: hypothetical protein IJZ28_02060, partial [Clostridia bacterium]|nr:hypothetical protein [Clostridia bacterium]
NTHRDKSLAGFSIYACGVRYVLTHSICLLRKRGIYLISIRGFAKYISQNAKISSLSAVKAYRVNEVDISTEEKIRARIED